MKALHFSIGIFLLIAGIGSLQMVLEQGERKDWFDSYFIIGFLIAAICAYGGMNAKGGSEGYG